MQQKLYGYSMISSASNWIEFGTSMPSSRAVCIGFDKIAKRIGRGNPMMRREYRKLDASAAEERVGGDEEDIGPVAHKGGKCRFDLAAGARVEDLSLQSEGAGSFRRISKRGPGGRGIGRVD